MTGINFTRLFSIDVLNNGYRDNNEILQHISIIPDEETSQKMNGYSLVNKVMSNRLICFVRTQMKLDSSTGSVKIIPINKPFIDINVNDVLFFNVILNSSYFVSNSNVGSFYDRNKTFLFSNDSNTVHFRLTKEEFVSDTDQVNSDEKIFAQIKISMDRNLPNGFSILNATNEITAKEYSIQFKKN